MAEHSYVVRLTDGQGDVLEPVLLSFDTKAHFHIGETFVLDDVGYEIIDIVHVFGMDTPEVTVLYVKEG